MTDRGRFSLSAFAVSLTRASVVKDRADVSPMEAASLSLLTQEQQGELVSFMSSSRLCPSVLTRSTFCYIYEICPQPLKPHRESLGHRALTCLSSPHSHNAPTPTKLQAVSLFQV